MDEEELYDEKKRWHVLDCLNFDHDTIRPGTNTAKLFYHNHILEIVVENTKIYFVSSKLGFSLFQNTTKTRFLY